jgi:riboflavin kinase/FMN adenylyltransferase
VELHAAAAASGISVSVIPRLESDGEPISSSRIRLLIGSGEMAAAARLLGRPYAVHGHAVSGRQLGRRIGFPTLNVPWDPELAPPYGVYAARVFQGAIDAPAVLNFGVRPTVESAPPAPLMEVHLLDWPRGFLQHLPMRVEWLHFIRPEQRFRDLGELRRQIAEDVQAAAAIVQPAAAKGTTTN